MAGFRDHHATIFLPRAAAEPIEAVRRAWDPAMAAQIAAHVTLAYPQEAPAVDLLVERLRAACAAAAPFRLRLGALGCFDGPEGGVYVGIDDLDGGYAGLRREVLTPPFRPVSFPPHATLVHPRTSSRGREFWEQRPYAEREVVFSVEEIAVTAFDGTQWAVLDVFPLGHGG